MRDVEPNLRRASHGGLLREDAEQQQCLVVLLHAVPFDFTYDQLPELPEWLAGVVPEQPRLRSRRHPNLSREVPLRRPAISVGPHLRGFI
jgi:hypothetical protein